MATRSIPSGGPQHRIPKVAKKRAGAKVNLPLDHSALVNAHTLFPSKVVHASVSPRLLVSGFNSRKTGAKVTVGRWAGMPIYTLTLEERATCPRSCEQWRTCYGNNMHHARRHIIGAAFERRLIDELDALAIKHPAGFVVRLHILGDFYSADYVRLWSDAFDRLPALRVFGYTAHDPETAIGNAVLALSFDYRDRCRIRFSGTDAGGLGSLVINRIEESEHVVCPAQTDKTDCCATCGLCWSMDRTVEFLRH